MTAQVASLEAVFTANTANFDRGAASVERTTTSLGSRMGASMQSAGRSITNLGTSLLTLGGVAAAGFGGAITAAVQFESAFAGVIKTVDATDEQLAIIRDTIRDMATDASNPVAGMENAHVVLAQIMEAAGQLGVGADDLVNFTQVMGELGLSTNITATDAATLTAQFANITGMSFDNVRNFGSTIVALGNSSATTESAILSMASRLASAGSLAGMSQQDILGFSAALSSAGISAELGGSNFSRLIMELNSVVANGGAGLARLGEITQTSAEAFATAWRDDPTAALQVFLESMGDLPLEYQTANLDAFGMSGTEMARVVLSLSGNTELLADSLETAGTAWTENTALATEANARLATTEAQMNVTKNQVRDLAITVGSALLPAFNDILRGIRPIIEGFANWAAENPQLVQGAAMLAAGVAGLGAVLIPLGMAISAVGTVLGVLLSPIGLVVAAVAGLALAFSTNFLGIRDIIQPVVDTIANGVGRLFDSIGWFIADIREMGIVDAILNAFGFGSNGVEIGDSWIEGVLVTFGMARDTAHGLVTTIGGAIAALKSGGLSGLADFIGEQLSNAAAAVGTRLSEIGASIVTYVTGGQLVADAQSVGTAIWDGIGAGIALIGDIGQWVFDNVIGPAALAFAGYARSGQLWDDVSSIGEGIWEGILAGLRMVGELRTWVFMNVIAPLAEGVAAYVGSGQLSDDLENLGADMLARLAAGIAGVGAIVDWFGEHVITPMATAVVTYIGSGQLHDDLVRLGGDLLDAIGTGLPEIGTWVNTNIVQPFISALSGLGMSVVDAINNAIPNNISIDLGILGDVGIDIADNPLPGGSGGGGGGGGGGGPVSSNLWNMPGVGAPIQIPNAGGFAGGGMIPGGHMATVGENGPERIFVAQDTGVIPNGGGGSPQIGNVTIYANDYAGGQAAARGFRDELEMMARASG